MTVRFGPKVPGTSMEIRTCPMDFAYGESFTESSPEAYERLILDVASRRREPLPAHGGGRGVLADPRPHRGALGRARQARGTRQAQLGPPRKRTRCSHETDGAGAGHEDRPHRHHGKQINKALVQGRRPSGTPRSGMVLTMVIVTDEENAYDATQGRRARRPASTSRTPRRDQARARTPRDRQGSGSTPRCGSASDAGTGETVILRLYGEVRRHADSVVLPLLLPDAPVVVWWPVDAPDEPCQGPAGRARRQRRITDTVRADEDALDAARPARAASYAPGRHRPGLDPAHPVALPCWPPALDQARTRHRLRGRRVRGRDGAELLARTARALARRRLGVGRARHHRRASCTRIRLGTPNGEIRIGRPDGPLAALSLPTAGPSAPSLKVARPPS